MSETSFDFFISELLVCTDFNRAQVSSWGWPGSVRIAWHGGRTCCFVHGASGSESETGFEDIKKCL